MKRFLLIVSFSLITQFLIGSEAKPTAMGARQFQKQTFEKTLEPISETEKAKPAFTLSAATEAAYQTYCAERRKLPNPNILTREQFMNPTYPQK